MQIMKKWQEHSSGGLCDMEEDQGGKRQQIMVTLSSNTTVDLFGPHEVKDELKTKTKLKE